MTVQPSNFNAALQISTWQNRLTCSILFVSGFRAFQIVQGRFVLNLIDNLPHFKATYYGEYPGGGACSLDPLSPMSSQSGWIRVAAGPDDFQNSLGCGMCVQITGSGKGSGSDPVTGVTKAIVHDSCGGCGKGDYNQRSQSVTVSSQWEILTIM